MTADNRTSAGSHWRHQEMERVPTSGQQDFQTVVTTDHTVPGLDNQLITLAWDKKARLKPLTTFTAFHHWFMSMVWRLLHSLPGIPYYAVVSTSRSCLRWVSWGWHPRPYYGEVLPHLIKEAALCCRIKEAALCRPIKEAALCRLIKEAALCRLIWKQRSAALSRRQLSLA